MWTDSPTHGPGTSWATAFQDIQSAIDAAQSNDTVLVTNGVYATGGRAVADMMTNRIAVAKPITVRSVNGPAVTTIKGEGPCGDNAIRCAFVGDGAVLAGFTLANGATHFVDDSDQMFSGGGVWCAASGVVSNCTFIANTADFGGGSSHGTLYNCTFTGNSASCGAGRTMGH